MAGETFKLIKTITVDASNPTSISFTNIPATFKDLKIVISARTANNTESYSAGTILLNGVNTTAGRSIPTVGSNAPPFTNVFNFWHNGFYGAADSYSIGNVYISDYASTIPKMITADFGAVNYQGNNIAGLSSGRNTLTSPVNSITFGLSTGGSTFVQRSTFTLYGI